MNGTVKTGPTTVTLKTEAPPFVPFMDWKYRPKEAFEAHILDVATGWCSGSPWVMSGDWFVGALKWADAVFRWDGKDTLTVEAGPDQALLLHEGPEVYSALSEYNRRVIQNEIDHPLDFGDPEVLYQHEFCTWVEQRYCRTAGKEMQTLSDTFVRNYLDRVAAMNLPPGKFTIDAGWYCLKGKGGVGDWLPDTARFPDMRKTTETIRSYGHTPGIWFGPWLIAADSKASGTQALCSGNTFKWLSADVQDQAEYKTLAVTEEAFTHIRNIFQRFADWGFRKIKLDIFYGPKRDMKPVLELVWRAAQAVDPDLELEAHVPDIFLSQYVNAVRTNDIWIKDTESFAYGPEHFRVCRLCSPHRVTNLDHIAGNGFLCDPTYAAAHLGTMMLSPGYPVVSVLPDRFGQSYVDLTRHLLENWQLRKNDFRNLAREGMPGLM